MGITLFVGVPSFKSDFLGHTDNDFSITVIVKGLEFLLVIFFMGEPKHNGPQKIQNLILGK